MGSEIAMEIDSDRPDRPSLTHNPKSFGIHLVKWTGVGGEFWFPWPVVPYGFTPENGCEVNLVTPQRRGLWRCPFGRDAYDSPATGQW